MPIGPYVAARELTGQRPPGTVRTLRATDRLTGMPVLLHLLPHAVPLPELPHDPALLPPSEGGIDGDTAYVVTELPLHARPVTDPLLAARGALAGLAALHEAGLTHGGVDTPQLWSVNGRVSLAGAGLPWEGERSPAADLRDLMSTLDALGGVPPALRDAPRDASARDLLARLEAGSELAPGNATAKPPRQAGEAGEDSAPSPDASAAPTPAPGVSSAPQATAGRVPPRRVAGDPVRITWDADGTRRVVKPNRTPRPASRRVPAALLVALALVLLLLAAALWAWRGREAVRAEVPGTGSAAAAQPCCDVRFTVRGDTVPVHLSLVSAPQGVPVTPDKVIGRAPGVVRLPQPGTYVLRVAAEGYTPGTVTVKVPSAVPVQIALAP